MNDFAEYPLVAWSMVAAPECLYSSGCFLLQKEAGVAALAAGKGDNESGLASSIGCRYAKKPQTENKSVSFCCGWRLHGGTWTHPGSGTPSKVTLMRAKALSLASALVRFPPCGAALPGEGFSLGAQRGSALMTVPCRNLRRWHLSPKQLDRRAVGLYLISSSVCWFQGIGFNIKIFEEWI